MAGLGRQFAVELHGCNTGAINDERFVRETLLEAARAAGAHVVGSIFHTFAPQGISGVVVIAESHLAVHSWPELGYAAVDVFTCGDTVDPLVAVDYIKDAFRATQCVVQEIPRGIGVLPAVPAC